jgi:transposase
MLGTCVTSPDEKATSKTPSGAVSGWSSMGWVRSSFVPPRPLRELRDLVRYRKAKIQERTREVQRVEKTLQDAGIKLSSVASEVIGVSARRMLDALIAGTHDPEMLADLAKGTLRKKIPALREALQGRFSGHHALLVGQMLAQIDFLDETIATLSVQIEELTRPFSRELELLDTSPGSTAARPRCCWPRSAPT